MALGEKSEDDRSLRDDLAAGLKEIEEREALAPEPGDEGAQPSQAEAKPEVAEANTDRGDGRDAHGKFVAKPKEGSTDGEQPTPAAADPAKAPEGQASEQPASPPVSGEDQPPKSWRADEAKAWAVLPAEAKAAITRREAEAARLAGANDSERMFGREFAEIVRPHMPTIQQFGVTPQQAVKALLDSDQVLRSSTPEQKIAHARKLCFDYGIDVAALAQPDPNFPADPHVAALQAQVAQLSQRLATPQQQQFTPLPLSPEDSNVQLEIEAFRADPAHPHFDAVHQVMGQLLETGAAPDLESAYHAAVTLNPALRSTVAAPAPQRTQEEKTAAARRASASVASSPGPTGNATPMSLRDELREQMRSAGFSV
jgi:hypothetical protein